MRKAPNFKSRANVRAFRKSFTASLVSEITSVFEKEGDSAKAIPSIRAKGQESTAMTSERWLTA